LLIKSVCQFPKENSVKTFWGIVELLPYLMNGIVFVKRPGKSRKHVTDEQFMSPLGKKLDVLMARRSKIQ
jgi:hypothetical protein